MTNPTVEIVNLRAENEMPSSELAFRLHEITFMRFSSGSPIPIIHDIGNTLLACQIVAPAPIAPAFRRGQVAFESEQTGRAEFAADRAADLARHTERQSPVHRNQHHFDQTVVMHFHEEFAGAIVRVALFLDDFRQDDFASGRRGYFATSC